MKLLIGSFLTFSMIWSLTLFAAGPEETIKDHSTGITFPRMVAFNADGQEYQLQATGVATRKKLFIKVYSMAHYLQEGADLQGGDLFTAILDSDVAKQLTLKWSRDVPAAKVQEAYHESFAKALSPAEQDQLKSQTDTYIGLFDRDVKKGDEHVLRWLPDGTTEVLINGKTQGHIEGNAFSRALWAIWFGNHDVVDRKALVSLIK